jgi:hypothetical protein
MDGVSDTTDALGDILRAGLALATGADRTTFSFDGEPNEWRWFFETFRLRILGFASIFACELPERGALLFEAECNPENFARAALAVGQSVFSRHGIEGYNEHWGWHPFPF